MKPVEAAVPEFRLFPGEQGVDLGARAVEFGFEPRLEFRADGRDGN